MSGVSFEYPVIAMIIRAMESSDAAQWEAMRRELWPAGEDEHAAEIASFFAGTIEEPQAVFAALDEGGTFLGFAELSIRKDVAGLQHKRVGYVEGLYVAPAFRSRGIARQLLKAARAWARDEGCEAFASDRAERVIEDKRFHAD